MALFSSTVERDSFAYVQMTTLRKSMLLLAGAILAAAVVAIGLPMIGIVNLNLSWITFFGIMALGFAVNKVGDTALGYALVIFAGVLLGATISPAIFYIMATQGTAGFMLIAQAFFTTFLLFLLMGVLAFFTNINFVKFAPFIFVAFIALIILSLLNVFWFHSSVGDLFISYAIAVVVCASVAARLNYVARGNYFTATSLALSLLVDFYNLFVSLLRIFSSRN